MTRAEISAFFPGMPPHFGGMEFAVPTVAWLQGPCYDYFKQRYWSLNLDKWQLRWECRDFARAFAVCAHECHALSSGAPAGADALAVGEFWFTPDASVRANPGAPVGHAINACITDQGLVYLEPQTGKLWPLSQNEFLRRFFVRFYSRACSRSPPARPRPRRLASTTPPTNTRSRLGKLFPLCPPLSPLSLPASSSTAAIPIIPSFCSSTAPRPSCACAKSPPATISKWSIFSTLAARPT